MEDNKGITTEPLHYEETPIIEPVSMESPPAVPSSPQIPPQPPLHSEPLKEPPSKSSSTIMHSLGIVVFFVLLFAVGVWLSTILRQYLPTGLSGGIVPTPKTTTSPEPTTTIATGTSSLDPYGNWKSYQVVSGKTKQVITGISFKLPADVLVPICDGANCASQGTYLPGGTRFTIAPRGVGQLLTDYRGRIVSDLAGKEFTVKQTTISGKPAVEFTGLFTGTTVGGYAFAQMRGVMIEVDDTLSLEVNHFTPSGVTSDFASDDSLFDKILETLTFTGFTSLQKGAIIVSPTSTQSASPSAQ